MLNHHYYLFGKFDWTWKLILSEPVSFCLEFETDYEQVSIKKNRRNGEGGGGTTTRGTTVAKLKFRGLCQSCSGGCQVASQWEASRPTTTTAKAAYWGGVPPPKKRKLKMFKFCCNFYLPVSHLLHLSTGYGAAAELSRFRKTCFVAEGDRSVFSLCRDIVF